MRFGAHVSIQPSLSKAPENAAAIGAECFQFFSQSPRGGPRVMPKKQTAEKFKKNLAKFDAGPTYVHAPYFINLASKNQRIFYGSIGAIKKDLEIASMLGSVGVVTHLGSAKDYGEINKLKNGIEAIPKEARQRVVLGLNKILEDYRGKARLILEISAGAGSIIGSNLDQLAYFSRQVKRVGGVCFDTAHAFESGLDITSKDKVKKFLDKIERTTGMNKLLLIHVNDSKSGLGSKVDRHEHLGQGELGMECFAALVGDKRLRNKDFVLETPTIEGMKEDLKLLKALRDDIYG
ncbi:MAG: deoxyribonuclease IV [Patescibacteria group bacterium]